MSDALREHGDHLFNKFLFAADGRRLAGSNCKCAKVIQGELPFFESLSIALVKRRISLVTEVHVLRLPEDGVGGQQCAGEHVDGGNVPDKEIRGIG